MKKVILYLVTFLFSINVYAQNVLFYDFEDNNVGDTNGTKVIDKSEFNNTGYFKSGSDKGAVIVEPGADGSKRAVELNGESDKYDYVYAEDSDSLSITGDLTLSAWIYRNSDPKDKSGIITKTYQADTHEVEYWFGVVGDHLQYYDNASNSILDDNQSMELNKWYHVAMVRSIKDKTLKFYIDGKLIYTANDINTDINDTNYGVSIGSCVPCYAPLNGKVDCPIIHNNALSDEEIVEDKDSCKPKACLGDRVWLDDGDGIQDSGESGFKDVNVTLLDDNGTYLNSMLTDSNGTYKFCGLAQGRYKIKVNKPSGYSIVDKNQGNDKERDSDVDSSSGITDVIDFNATADDFSWDIGLYKEPTKTASLGDKVWLDVNYNGLQDANESGVKGVKVYLLDSNSSKIKELITDDNGEYLFTDLEPGTYSIEFDLSTLPQGAKVTKQNTGDDSRDSDANRTSGQTEQITLNEGDVDKSWDMGIYYTSCIGDFVWLDKNGNGVQNSGEPGVEGVKVEVYDGDKLAGSDTTRADGKYHICNLEPNVEYSVKFDLNSLPSGMVVTTKDAVSDEIDSDVDATTGDAGSDVLTPKEDNVTFDMGVYKTACLGDRVWEDNNSNDIQDAGENGVDGVKVHLFDADDNELNSTTTQNGGEYKFCGLKPGSYYVKVDKPDGFEGFSDKKQGDDDSKDSDVDSSGKSVTVTLNSGDENFDIDAGLIKKAEATYCIGDFVWEDTNNNDIQDSNESGIKDVTVKLYEDGNTTVKATTTTDANGKYKFCNLKNGDYVVEFVKPNGYDFTDANQGTDDTKDSDADQTTGKSGIITIADANNTTVDAGVIKHIDTTYCIGDYVWEDKNANGIQDNNESGFANVEVKLLNENGDELNSTTTDSSGKYEFCGLSNGDYIIEVSKPEGYVYTLQNEGSDDEKDSDIDQNSGRTLVVTIDNANNYSVDAGIVSKDDYERIHGGSTKGICLGDYVWYDENLNGIADDGNGNGVVDVPVHLYTADGSSVTDINGEVVKATKTDKDGKYKFCNLIPGRDYIIKIDVPDTYLPTKANIGDDAKDSDINSKGEIFVNAPMQDNMSLDAGIYCECDDYKVNPQEHKELKAPSLSFVGIALALIALTIIAVRRGKEV